MTAPLALVLLALASGPEDAAAAAPQAPASATTGEGAAWDVGFLAEDRPVFLRLRVKSGDRPFDAAGSGPIRALFAWLDRDGDGTLTAKEAGKETLAALVRLATGEATAAMPREAAGDAPEGGAVSMDELAEALRPAYRPFRIQLGRLANGRTDALFDHLDRDKDEQLTRSELAAIAGSVRRLDLDDNETISPDELEPFVNTATMRGVEVASERRARYTALPPFVELVAGESSLRSARLLLKKYDKGRADGPGRPDGKLSRTEFAIDPDTFAGADRNGDDALTVEELRRFLDKAPIDLILDVTFSPGASGRATVRVGGDPVTAKDAKVRQLADGDVEFAVSHARLDVHVDDGGTVAEDARRILLARFRAADANKNGYLEGSELARENAAPSPLAGLVAVVDRDGDGKLYPKELTDFVDLMANASRDRLVLTVSDQGRAIFGILDLDRDGRLGAREVMRTVERITSWDEDGDGRVGANEIPYHFQVSLARGALPGLSAGAAGAARAGSQSAAPPRARAGGPDWFRQMDRNRDGDVSWREFLGPRDQFNHLDRDGDGLIGAEEADAANAAAKAAGGR